MMTLRKIVLAVAVAGTFALGAAGPAQATPIASAVSVVSFENFVINWATIDGGRQVDKATDFQTLSVTSSLLTSANMTGEAGVSNNPSSSTGANLTSKSSLGTVDAGLNSTGVITASQAFNVPTLPMTGNFSHSVSNETGAPILNFPNSSAPVTANADLHSGSYASLDTLAGTAGNSSSSQLASTQVFTALVGGDSLVFSFDVGAYIGAFLSLNAAQTASAGWDVNISLINNSKVFDDPARQAAVFAIGDSISNNQPGTGATIVGGQNTGLTAGLPTLVNFSFGSLPIIAGDTYQLTATFGTRVQAERVAVPEPIALSLLGIGLLGLGASRRMLRKTAA